MKIYNHFFFPRSTDDTAEFDDYEFELEEDSGEELDFSFDKKEDDKVSDFYSDLEKQVDTELAEEEFQDLDPEDLHTISLAELED